MGAPRFADRGTPVSGATVLARKPRFGQFGRLAAPSEAAPTISELGFPMEPERYAIPQRVSIAAREPAVIPAPQPLALVPRVRSRSTMADFPSMQSVPLTPAGEPEQQQPRVPFVPHHTRQSQPTLTERLGAHAREGFQNTLAGQFLSGVRGGERYARQAEQLDKVIHYAESQGSRTALPLPADIDPQSGMPISDPNQGAMDYIGHRFVGVPLDQLRRERRAAQEAYAPLHAAELAKQNVRRFEYETMPGAKTLPEQGAAVIGELAGGLPTPESVIPVTRGATLLKTFARGAAVAGLTNLLTDPLVQSAQITQGTRKAFDPAQPFLGAAGGAFLGGTLNVAPEVASKIAKVVAAKLGKAASAVTNSDVWKAMSSWLRNPDSMPDELKTEPTLGQRPGATTEQPATPGQQPAPKFREYGIPVQKPTSEPVYQGGIRGEPFALPQKPEGQPVSLATEYPARTAWPADFPPIIVNRPSVSPVRMIQHADFPAAKTGDVEAARRVVTSMIDPAQIEAIRTAIGDQKPMVVPIHAAEEDPGRNMLAFGYADELAHRLGLEVDDDIVQINRPKRRQAGSSEDRFGKRVLFDGAVTPGQTYILADDHVTMGGTLADLRAYIESRGGRVILATTLTASRGSGRLALAPNVLAALRSKYGNLEPAWRAKYGHGFEGFTNAEAFAFLKLTNEARNRLVAGVQEGAGGEVPRVATTGAAAGETATVAAPPRLPEGATLTPSAIRHGDIGTLGPNVPRSDIQLIGILDRADARRFAPKANAIFKEAADEQRAAFVAQLDGILARLHSGETGPFEATLQTVRGKATRFRFENARKDAVELVGAIESLKSRLEGTQGQAKFYSVDPSATPARGRPRFTDRGTRQQSVAAQPAGTLQAQPGAAHVGPVVQTYNPATPIAKDPLRRESILKEFTKGMGMPIYQGRIKSPKMLGFFRPRVGEVRIKHPSDIETAAHEMAHLLDNRVPEIRQQWLPASNANATIRKELAGVSYDQTKIFEGFAEFVRLL